MTSASGEQQQDRIRAASVRVAMGVFAVVMLPIFVPAAKGYMAVLLAYVVGAVVFQVAIRYDVGGSVRVLLGGIMDTAFITFLVYRNGTQSTPLVGAYLLSGMFNALVAPAWCARIVAALGVLAFSGVSFAEAFHLLPYGPDVPELAGMKPSVTMAVHGALLLGALVAVSTLVSDRLAKALHTREQQLRIANGRLEELSQRDPLTQLFNRRHFVHRVDEELARVRRGHPMALVMIDLDGFKHVNDKQGHLAGDDLLRRIARAIEDTTRAVDVVGRFGGDEFVAMLPDTDPEQAGVVAGRLVRTVFDIGSAMDERRPVTASIGVAIARAEDDVTVLLNAADEGCYSAKTAGGNQFHTVLGPRRNSSIESGPRAAQTG